MQNNTVSLPIQASARPIDSGIMIGMNKKINSVVSNIAQAAAALRVLYKPATA